MALRLQIISRHRQSLGDRAVKEFGRDGGTIGRSLESDWVLPDGQRYISSRHASIDYRSGSYYVVDTSTNGVYVNDAEQPVGRGNPQRLFSGDRVRLGEYELSVEIDEVDSTADELANENHVDPVSRAQRVPPPDPTRADLLQAHEITAVGIDMLVAEETRPDQVRELAQRNVANLRLEDEPPPAKHVGLDAPAPATASSTPPAVPKANDEPPPVSAAARVTAKRRETPAAAIRSPAGAHAPQPSTVNAAPNASPPPSPAATAPPSGVLDAFFRGAGLPSQRLDPQQAEQTLHRLGQLMRETIVGLTESLRVRTEQKNALRASNTTIQPQNNNPLKFYASLDEALQNLLFRQSSEYLSGVEAVREAFLDIKQHQQCMLGALRTAIADYVGRLDPDELESKFSHGKRGGLMNAANKLKYWELYKDLYQVVAQAPHGQLPQQFVEDLTRAYETETSRTGKKASGFA